MQLVLNAPIITKVVLELSQDEEKILQQFTDTFYNHRENFDDKYSDMIDELILKNHLSDFIKQCYIPWRRVFYNHLGYEIC